MSCAGVLKEIQGNIESFQIMDTTSRVRPRIQWSGRIGVAVLGRFPLPPDTFLRAAYRLLGAAADASHEGRRSASFAYRAADGAVLVTWGDLLGVLLRLPLPTACVPVPTPASTRGRATVAFRHLTPTLLKRRGGPKVPWFDPEGYAAALAGVLGIAGATVSLEEAGREVRFVRVRAEPAVWDLGRGTVRGFVGEVVANVPAAWAGTLRAARFTGLGCKRAWGMGNVDVMVLSAKGV